MSFVRIAQTTRVVLTHTFYVDGVATDATGTPTVSIKRLDGTEVATPAVSHPGPLGQYTYPVTQPETNSLDMLIGEITAVVAGVTVKQRDFIEVAGGFYFGLTEARDELKLSALQWPDSKLAAHRITVEDEAERICGIGFVPRFARVKIDGTGRTGIMLPRADVRAIRSITLDGSTVDASNYQWSESGLIRSKGRNWTEGLGNVVVEFEYGMEWTPPLVSKAAILRLRSQLSQTVSEIPGRASTFTVQGGGTYRLSLPTKDKTGIADVDGVYEKYIMPDPGFA